MKQNESDNIIRVVIPTFNRSVDLAACLQSLALAGLDGDDIIVVDNASTDDTVSCLRIGYPFVQLICLPENRGATGAANAGFDLALSQGADFVLRLDSDTLVAPDFLGPLLRTIQSDSQIGVVSPKIYYADPPDEIWYAGAMAKPLTFGAKGHRHEKDSPENSQLQEVDYIWAAAMLIRREVLLATSGFDLDFFVYYEEVDFCERVRKLGYRMMFVPSSFVWHKVGSSANNAWTAYHWNRSKMLLYRKHSKNKLHLFMLVIYSFVYAFTSSIINSPDRNRGPLKYLLKGIISGLKHQNKFK